MTPEQALQLLIEAAAAAHLPLVGHQNVQRAAEVLRKAITPEPDEEE